MAAASEKQRRAKALSNPSQKEACQVSYHKYIDNTQGVLSPYPYRYFIHYQLVS